MRAKQQANIPKRWKTGILTHFNGNWNDYIQYFPKILVYPKLTDRGDSESGWQQ